MTRPTSLGERLVKVVLLAFVIYERSVRQPKAQPPYEQQVVVGALLTLTVTATAVFHRRFERSGLIYAAAVVAWVSYGAFLVGQHTLSMTAAYLVPTFFVIAFF